MARGIRVRALPVAIALTAFCALAENPVRSFLPEQKEIWTSPRKIERRQWPWLVLAGAGTAALIATDVRITKALPNTQEQFRWSTRTSRLGGAAGLAIFSGSVLAVGALSHDKKWQSVGLTSSEALAHSLVVTYALKAVFSRERPDSGSAQGRFWSGAAGTMAKSDHSFPSGHSMASWAVASAVARQFPGKRYVPWIAYGFATAISASRVAAHRHYAADVAVGAGAGYLIGRLVGNRRH